MADNLTPTQRSYMMSCVRSTDTSCELTIRRLAHARGLRFRKHCSWLPGRPDLVFVSAKVAVFVDGDYWHGWRFPCWQAKLPLYWREKIERNRKRDHRNFRKLRRSGWRVIRIWEHQVERDAQWCADLIETAVRAIPSAQAAIASGRRLLSRPLRSTGLQETV